MNGMAAAPARTLPTIRPRKNSETQIYIDADTYQAAILNIKLPNGIRILEEDFVHKMMQNMKKKKCVNKKKQLLEEQKETKRK